MPTQKNAQGSIDPRVDQAEFENDDYRITKLADIYSNMVKSQSRISELNRTLSRAFFANEGILDKDSRDEFVENVETMEKRVFTAAHAAFMTLTLAGRKDYAALGFDPSVIIIDEAGQATPSAEPIEPEPASPLQMIAKSSRRNTKTLTLQYPIPSIVKFPSEQFYNNLLKSHPIVEVDHPIRQIVRKFSHKTFNV
ncbi:MAG: hypothetical protein Q9220_006303 [cf. Caloplaca sp. 1 TL-2023]